MSAKTARENEQWSNRFAKLAVGSIMPMIENGSRDGERILDLFQAIKDVPGTLERCHRLLGEVTVVVNSERLPIPGEVFELTMPREISGLEVVDACEFGHGGWRFTGTSIPLGTTKKFKFVEDSCDDVSRIAQRLAAKYGPPPSGLWMKVLHEVLNGLDIRPREIACADFSWVDRDNRPRSLAISPKGSLEFHFDGYATSYHLCWLVEV